MAVFAVLNRGGHRLALPGLALFRGFRAVAAARGCYDCTAAGIAAPGLRGFGDQPVLRHLNSVRGVLVWIRNG